MRLDRFSRLIPGTHGCWSVDIEQDKLKATKCAGYVIALKTWFQAGTKSGTFRSRPAGTIIIAGVDGNAKMYQKRE